VVFIYTVSGFVRDGRANGGGRHQVLGGSEWMGRCGGGRYKRSLSGGSPVIVCFVCLSAGLRLESQCALMKGV
jgi:hypothetical protein